MGILLEKPRPPFPRIADLSEWLLQASRCLCENLRVDNGERKIIDTVGVRRVRGVPLWPQGQGHASVARLEKIAHNWGREKPLEYYS